MKENVYAAPKSQIVDDSKPFALCGDGRFVVTRRDTDWGNRCCYCNAVAEKKSTMRINYYPFWAKFFGFILALLVIFTLRLGVLLPVVMVMSVLLVVIFSVYLMGKTIKVHVTLCAEHRKMRFSHRCVVALFLLLFVLVQYATVRLQLPVGLYAVFVVLLVVAFIVMVMLLPKPLVSMRQLDDLFWVKGTGEAFRDNLPEFR